MRLFFALERSSQETYGKVRELEQEFHPDFDVLSFDKVKREIQSTAGVVPITNHMCPKSCLAYTGPPSTVHWRAVQNVEQADMIQ